MSLKHPIYIFTDLDDSLFQTQRKCPERTTLVQAATDRHGQPLSYFTPEQKALVALLEQGTVIPVTGRNTAALERVYLDFASYRITSHGALVLGVDGRLDTEWLTVIHNQYERWIERMEIARSAVSDLISRYALDARCRIIEDQGLPVYVSIKGEEQAICRLSEAMVEVWRAADACIHRNGQNMALLPPFACKKRAVAFLMERLSQEDADSPLFIGIGDSATDLPFLKLCHYAVIPRHSQIQEQTWS